MSKKMLFAPDNQDQPTAPAITGETVEKEDIGRGYEIGKGQYLPVKDDELEKIEIESTHTIEIDSFVPRPEIDDRYPVSPYYIAPTDRVGFRDLAERNINLDPIYETATLLTTGALPTELRLPFHAFFKQTDRHSAECPWRRAPPPESQWGAL